MSHFPESENKPTFILVPLGYSCAAFTLSLSIKHIDGILNLRKSVSEVFLKKLVFEAWEFNERKLNECRTWISKQYI